MSDVILLPAGGGEIIGDAEDRRVEILSDHDALHATWSRFGPHREGADPHVHRRHTDVFYVLEGELTIGLGAARAETIAPAGTLVLAPPLVIHSFRNGSTGEVRYLNFHAPGEGFADYLRGRRDGREVSFDQEDPPADGGRPASHAVVVAKDEPVTDEAGLRVTLLVDTEEIGIVEVWSEPGSAQPLARYEHSKSFYVLEGELTFSLGREETRAETGAWIQVPGGIEFTVAASGSDEACYLEIQAPSRGVGVFRR